MQHVNSTALSVCVNLHHTIPDFSACIRVAAASLTRSPASLMLRAATCLPIWLRWSSGRLRRRKLLRNISSGLLSRRDNIISSCGEHLMPLGKQLAQILVTVLQQLGWASGNWLTYACFDTCSVNAESSLMYTALQDISSVPFPASPQILAAVCMSLPAAVRRSCWLTRPLISGPSCLPMKAGSH